MLCKSGPIQRSRSHVHWLYTTHCKDAILHLPNSLLGGTTHYSNRMRRHVVEGNIQSQCWEAMYVLGSMHANLSFITLWIHKPWYLCGHTMTDTLVQKWLPLHPAQPVLSLPLWPAYLQVRCLQVNCLVSQRTPAPVLGEPKATPSVHRCWQTNCMTYRWCMYVWHTIYGDIP